MSISVVRSIVAVSLLSIVSASLVTHGADDVIVDELPPVTPVPPPAVRCDANPISASSRRR